MDPQFIQTLRYKLQRRIRRLNGVDWHLMGTTLKQIWPFIRNSELFMGLLDPVLKQCPESETKAQHICDKKAYEGEDELESVAIAFYVIERVVSNKDPVLAAVGVGAVFTTATQYADYVDVFRDRFVAPLYEYLDEQLDDQRAVCALLIKYKHRSEWFARSELQELLQDSAHGEKRLAMDLYRYLHDQGMEFHIEPRSESGEIDLLGDQTGEQRLALDAKIFDPGKSKGKAYLVTAFNQVYIYARDYNESAAYLAIYQATPKEPKFTFAKSDSIFPYIEHNGKIIYFVVIDITAYEDPASKRGKSQVIEINKDDLIKSESSTEE